MPARCWSSSSHWARRATSRYVERYESTRCRCCVTSKTSHGDGVRADRRAADLALAQAAAKPGVRHDEKQIDDVIPGRRVVPHLRGPDERKRETDSAEDERVAHRMIRRHTRGQV